MVKYTIYEISCKDENVKSTYVGQTKAFNNRKENHKNPLNDKTRSSLYSYPLYKAVRENGGWDNWEIKPLEILDCDKDKAHEREQYWMDLKKANLNQNRAFDTNLLRREKQKEYNKKNKIKKRNEILQKICNIYNADINEMIEYIENLDKTKKTKDIQKIVDNIN
jgi:hypothetical protein